MRINAKKWVMCKLTGSIEINVLRVIMLAICFIIGLIQIDTVLNEIYQLVTGYLKDTSINKVFTLCSSTRNLMIRICWLEVN